MTISPNFQEEYLRSRLINSVADARKRVFNQIDMRCNKALEEIMRAKVCSN